MPAVRRFHGHGYRSCNRQRVTATCNVSWLQGLQSPTEVGMAPLKPSHIRPSLPVSLRQRHRGLRAQWEAASLRPIALEVPAEVSRVVDRPGSEGAAQARLELGSRSAQPTQHLQPSRLSIPKAAEPPPHRAAARESRTAAASTRRGLAGLEGRAAVGR